MDHFDTLLHEIRSDALVSASLTSPQGDVKAQKLTIRSISLKGRQLYQLSEYVGTQVLHRNLSSAECARLFNELVPKVYGQAVCETTTATYHFVMGKVKRKERTSSLAQVPIQHNKSKKYPFPEGEAVPFLVELGVMRKDGKVVREKYDKFRQINHFIELIEGSLEKLPTDRPLHIVDFGSGKSYLTFALHYYLTHSKKLSVHITGIDLKKDVVEHCQALAKKLGDSSLRFIVGDIKEYVPDTHIDMVITLHACDLATDAALVKSVAWGAEVILSVPCCQHELFQQVESAPLESLLRHGILKERFSALVTDAMRAELLTAAGYAVDVIEFIPLEHTPKNIMIRAVKNPSEKRSKEALERYHELQSLLHIHPWLEDHLLKEKRKLGR